MIEFHKYHGLGNDFILVDADAYPKFDFGAVAESWCNRHFGIGADGLITVRRLGDRHWEMRIFNSDGGECEMCGNGTRCVTAYLAATGKFKGEGLELKTLAGPIRPALLPNGLVRVDMGEPRSIEKEIKIELPGCTFTGTNVSMGNPHFVVFVDDIATVNLNHWGPLLEKHPYFPHRTNVEFVEVRAAGLVRMRVWERGCGITLACGTGSCATAVAGVVTGRTGRTVTELLDGGELQIEYSETDNHVYMTGSATCVFHGTIPNTRY